MQRNITISEWTTAGVPAIKDTATNAAPTFASGDCVNITLTFPTFEGTPATVVVFAKPIKGGNTPDASASPIFNIEQPYASPCVVALDSDDTAHVGSFVLSAVLKGADGSQITSLTGALIIYDGGYVSTQKTLSQSESFISESLAGALAAKLAADVDKAQAQAANAAAQTAKESAQASAETATAKANDAIASAETATTKAAEASTSAATAATKAGEASTSASAAHDDAVDAAAAKTAAIAAKDAAETARDNAQSYKGEAETSAANALNAQAAAEAAQGVAETAQASAEASATSATESAASAAESADDAANSLNFYNALAYQGTCTALPSNPTRGQFWVVAQAFDNYAAGDAILYNGTAWQSLDLDTLTAQAQADARAQTNAAIAARGMARCPTGTAASYPAWQHIVRGTVANFGTFPLSICFSYRSNLQWENGRSMATKYVGGIGANGAHFDASFGSNATQFCFIFTSNTNTGYGLHRHISASAMPTDGRLHTVVFTMESATATGACYVDGILVPFVHSSIVNFSGDFTNTSELMWGVLKNEIEISRMKIFNFALPATAAADCALATPYGYSAEAYANGEDEPTALRDTSATARALLSLDDRTCGGVLFDRSGAENHARFTGDAAPEKPAESCAFTQALSWAGTSEAKAFLNANAIALPANARVCARLKASAGATFNLTDGAATPTTLATSGALTADAWGEVVFYTSAASKLALKPTAAYTGTLDVQVRIEKLK